MMTDEEFGDLMRQSAAWIAESRAELDRLRPQLIALREIYEAYIRSIDAILFGASPPLPNGRIAPNLPPVIEAECRDAVVKVLKAKLAKVNKALGRASA
jgi:hypothetical protein